MSCVNNPYIESTVNRTMRASITLHIDQKCVQNLKQIFLNSVITGIIIIFIHLKFKAENKV